MRCGNQVRETVGRDGFADAEDEGTASGHFGFGVGDFAQVREEEDERDCSAGQEEEGRSPGAVEDDLPRRPAKDDEEESEGDVDGDSERAGKGKSDKDDGGQLGAARTGRRAGGAGYPRQ